MVAEHAATALSALYLQPAVGAPRATPADFASPFQCAMLANTRALALCAIILCPPVYAQGAAAAVAASRFVPHVPAQRAAAAVFAIGASLVVLTYGSTALIEKFALSACLLCFAVRAVCAAAAVFAKVSDFVVGAQAFAAKFAVGALPQVHAHASGWPRVTAFVLGGGC